MCQEHEEAGHIVSIVGGAGQTLIFILLHPVYKVLNPTPASRVGLSTSVCLTREPLTGVPGDLLPR